MPVCVPVCVYVYACVYTHVCLWGDTLHLSCP